MGGKKSGGSSKTTQSVEPWGEQKPYLQGMFEAAGAGTNGSEVDDKLYPFYDSETGEYNYSGTMFAPDYYSGQTVADQDPYTKLAIDQQALRAYYGSGLNNSASNQLQSTLNGQYLQSPIQGYATSMMQNAGNMPDFLQAYNNGNGGGATTADISAWDGGGGNQYLDSMVERAQRQTAANVNSSYSMNGRYGSGAHAAAANDAAGNIATDMYGQAYDADQNRSLQAWNAYNQAKLTNAGLANSAADRDFQAWAQNQSNQLNAWNMSNQNSLTAQNMLQNAYANERGNMMQSMQFAPTLANQDYQDLSALSEAGSAKEAYNQSLINADIDRWNYDSAKDLTALQNYASMISGNYGMSGWTKQKGNQGSSNPLGGAMSGAMMGGAIGNQFGYGGYGAMGGGLLGMLGGM